MGMALVRSLHGVRAAVASAIRLPSQITRKKRSLVTRATRVQSFRPSPAGTLLVVAILMLRRLAAQRLLTALPSKALSLELLGHLHRVLSSRASSPSSTVFALP